MSAAAKAVVRRFYSGIFRDLSLAEGDKVIARVTGRGTHQGVGMAIAPTGRQVQVKGINIDRVVSDRICEHWVEADTIGMLLQMGVDSFTGPTNEQ